MSLRKYLILNDTHVGVQRSGGTTPASAIALRSWLLDSHLAFIMEPEFNDYDLIYNGDVFDQFNVPLTDALALVMQWVQWLDTHPDGRIFVGQGNHDIAKDSSKVSMFEFAGKMMQALSNRFFLITQPTSIDDQQRIYMIPHCPTQEMFEKALNSIPELTQFVLVHANYDNPFAEQADHSLSISVDQAVKIIKTGATLIFGHEHDNRPVGPNILIPGNQFPTSIADVSAVKSKLFVTITDGQASKHKYVDTAELYAEMEWDKLDPNAPQKFIKVVGEASAEQAAEVIAAVSEMRSAWNGFVLSNAVKVEGQAAVDEVVSDLEEIKAIDVVGFLLDHLNAEQAAVVSKFLKKGL